MIEDTSRVMPELRLKSQSREKEDYQRATYEGRNRMRVIQTHLSALVFFVQTRRIARKTAARKSESILLSVCLVYGKQVQAFHTNTYLLREGCFVPLARPSGQAIALSFLLL